VTKAKHKKFHKFVQKWLVKNVNELQRNDCNEWLMGHKSDLISNKTILKQDNDLTKTPYIIYNRYRVENSVNINPNINS
jgi:paired amphipathic helix protein Sin3a